MVKGERWDLPGKEQIKALLDFLPLFGDATSEDTRWHAQPGQFPHYAMSKDASSLLEGFYEHGFVVDFDWPSWSEGSRYIEQPHLIGRADLETLCRLITLHARQDRFTEGHFTAQLESGQIAAILKRLNDL